MYNLLVSFESHYIVFHVKHLYLYNKKLRFLFYKRSARNVPRRARLVAAFQCCCLPEAIVKQRPSR